MKIRAVRRRTVFRLPEIKVLKCINLYVLVIKIGFRHACAESFSMQLNAEDINVYDVADFLRRANL